MNQAAGLLANAFRDCLTTIVRLRGNRQTVTDAEVFRRQMRDALETAARKARDVHGYTNADVLNATFAVVALLDESILNSPDPVFADWSRKPLQEELFGALLAGELFFQHIRDLLGRPDSTALADVLEVYSLCLLLGFGGRHARVVGKLQERIRRIRGNAETLSPSWAPLPAISPQTHDPWLRRLGLAAVLCASLALVLFITYRVVLAYPVSQVRQIVSEVSHR